MATAGELIGRLFFARNVAHKEHLLTTLYSRHKALGDYYDGVVSLADKFAEAFMGKYGRPDDIALTWAEDSEDIQSFIQANVEWIEANRACEVQYIRAGDSDLARIYHERVGALRQMRGEIEVIVK